jgi:protein-S-isoprenylcysteine O-methyltransferase Ste14
MMEINDESVKASPNRIPWPPMIVVMTLIAGYALNSALPISAINPYLQSSTVRWIGSLLFLAGLALDLVTVLTMYRARTNILPHRAAGKLLTSGPYTLLLFGLSLRWANVWLLLLTAFATFAVDRLAIRREERHLQALFGGDFQRYAAQVSRWIGRRFQ